MVLSSNTTLLEFYLRKYDLCDYVLSPVVKVVATVCSDFYNDSRKHWPYTIPLNVDYKQIHGRGPGRNQQERKIGWQRRL